MHFQVYLPGVRTVDPQHLINAGLSTLVAGSAMVDSPGPDGSHGAMIYWHFGGGPVRWFNYEKSERQRWVPGPEKAYWVGILVDDPPTPEELMRPFQSEGERLKLNPDSEQVWMLPRRGNLDRSLTIQDDGSLKFEPLRKFSLFSQKADEFRERLFGATSGPTGFDWRELASLVQTALDLNYRMPAPLHLMLGLCSAETMKLAAIAMCCDRKAFQAFASGELTLQTSEA